jgi:xanthine dehydrogenase accessory factor
MVAIAANGEQTGSISGGCVEEALIADLLNGQYPHRAPTFVEYGVSAEDNEKLGLPCGGRLNIAVQRLTPLDLPWIQQALARLERRAVSRRIVDLQHGETTLVEVEQFESLQQTADTLRHCFGPRSRLLLVGAGQLAACIASLALAMDYEVLLTDSRDWALKQWQGPPVEKILGLPDDVVRERAGDRLSAVMTLSHDPRVDDMALMEALESDAWYVGALGSLRTTEKRRERLATLGLSPEAIARLHAPIGLSIGSKTPMEIAVSVMAEVTQLRRTVS